MDNLTAYSLTLSKKENPHRSFGDTGAYAFNNVNLLFSCLTTSFNSLLGTILSTSIETDRKFLEKRITTSELSKVS